MRITTVGRAGRRPLHRAPDDLCRPGGSLGRGELAAGLATAAVAGQLLFAPAALLSAAGLILVGWLSRWRPHWLAVPTAVGVIWLCAIGPVRAATGFAASARRLADWLLVAAFHPRLLGHPVVLAAGANRLLATGLPLALLAGCGEASLVLWLGCWRRSARRPFQRRWRPGLVAAVRRRISAAALTAGQTVTADGCAVGVATDTGKLAGLSWAEAMHGVLLTGQDLDLLGLAITCAALRRRKTVVIIECAGRSAGPGAHGSRAEVAARVRDLARSIGVPITDASGASAAGAVGRAIRRRETVLVETQAADAQEVVANLAAVLTDLRELGLRADCLAWINGAEQIDSANLAELVAVGKLTGTAIVLGTSNSAFGAQLVPATMVVAVGNPVAADMELALAARLRCPADAGRVIPVAHDAGEVTLLVFASAGEGISPAGQGPARAVTSCRALPITLDRRL